MMPKTARLRRARSVKNHLARFVEIQRPDIAALYAGKDVNPDYMALNRLLAAEHELSELIADLRAEGYGKRAVLGRKPE